VLETGWPSDGITRHRILLAEFRFDRSEDRDHLGKSVAKDVRHKRAPVQYLLYRLQPAAVLDRQLSLCGFELGPWKAIEMRNELRIAIVSVAWYFSAAIEVDRDLKL
jgi:hypothetical protein